MANKNIGLGTITLIAIALIIGIALLSTVSDKTNEITSLQTETNESFTPINGTGVVLTNADVASISAIRNSTNEAQTVNVDYTLNATNAITMINNETGTWYADYSYRADDYVTNSATRSITTLIIIFGALALLAVSLLPALGLMDMDFLKKK